MTPAEAARITAALSHIGGILDTLPLDAYLEHLREQRRGLPFLWQADDPVQHASRRRLQALIAAGTKGIEIAEEVQTASAFWRQARALQLEDPPPGVLNPDEHADPPGYIDPAGNVHHIDFTSRRTEARCKCPMGECSHRVGLDGPA